VTVEFYGADSIATIYGSGDTAVFNYAGDAANISSGTIDVEASGADTDFNGKSALATVTLGQRATPLTAEATATAQAAAMATDSLAVRASRLRPMCML
jgi:hypothetical protein